ncbi:MAG: UDP-N-acetylmuramate dehydrogenase [Nocardioidaceae bacterium]
MRTLENAPLAARTTLRLGGPARRIVEVDAEADLVEVVRAADAAGEPLLVLGGGSNVVVADEGFDGTVVDVRTRGVDVESDACGGAMVRVAAGEVWDDLVLQAVDTGWVGVEALAGIPGRVGAVPIQNVGAYGQEVAQTVASVRTLDRRTGAVATVAAADCGFGYRSSRFKSDPDAALVLSVTFQFPLGDLGAPIAYAELARTLDAAAGDRVPAKAVRESVLGLRAGKGMVLDADDHDTWSAGSFFTNPLLSAAQVAALPHDVPRWPQPDGTVKASAAWLIGQAGFGKGYGDGAIRLSTKHTLALTNRGGGTTAELLALAWEIRDGVRERFGVDLVNEPVLVGCTL